MVSIIMYYICICLLCMTLLLFFYSLDHKGRQHHLALIVYKFDGVSAHNVQIRSHGNSKSNSPHCRTMKSTVNHLEEELQSSSPKVSISKVMKLKGGIVSAKYAAELPLSRQNVYDLHRQMKVKSFCSSRALSRGKGHDLLFVMMEQCKLTDKVNRYVQEVTCAPEPMAVLATEQQILDLEHFCCNPIEYCIMGVDPTFNLGDFSVTPIVYQHLLVEDKKSEKHLGY